MEIMEEEEEELEEAEEKEAIAGFAEYAWRKEMNRSRSADASLKGQRWKAKRRYDDFRGGSRRVASDGIGRQRVRTGPGSRGVASDGIGNGMCVYKS
jgi:hypothetical protein